MRVKISMVAVAAMIAMFFGGWSGIKAQSNSAAMAQAEIATFSTAGVARVGSCTWAVITRARKARRRCSAPCTSM